MQHELGAGELLDCAGRLIEAGWAPREVRRYDRSRIRAGAWRIKEWDYYCILTDRFALALTVACALLMVSRIRFFSFRAWPGDRVPFWFLLLIVAVIIALLIDAPKVIFGVAVVYVLSGPVGWLWQRRRGAAGAP